ncbi:MAG: DUF4404 family protein [Proteobacteria bacterium]|nr:DUF4404 family protein [Pseudomonadota bacterium]
MAGENLRDLLARVHEHLSAAAPAVQEERQQLTTVLHDIERALGVGGEASGSAPRLEQMAVRFQATHPALAGSLRQLIDLLGKAGI